MSTNRTKVDWAYRLAQKRLFDYALDLTDAEIRALAADFRRAYRRGVREGSKVLRARRRHSRNTMFEPPDRAY